MLFQVYIIIILFCLGTSILNKVSRQNLLYIYFSLVVIIEIGFYLRSLPTVIYNASPLLYISFFTYYFGNQKNSNKKIIYAIGSIAFTFCLYLYVIEGFEKYSIQAGTAMNLVYIFFALQWLFNQLKYVDENSLLKKQAFWFSTSLLIWSVIFLFRLIPMYWLDIHDNHFLRQINLGYQITTILSYCLFLKGLFCKI